MSNALKFPKLPPRSALVFAEICEEAEVFETSVLGEIGAVRDKQTYSACGFPALSMREA